MVASAVATHIDSSHSLPDVLRLDMETQIEVTADEAVPFAVEKVADAGLLAGTVVVASAGVEGTDRNTYRVRLVGATAVERQLLGTEHLAAPVNEVDHVGTKPKPVIVVPLTVSAGGVQQIIIDAAARWGADSNQLLRVARCESGYNPNAYNASSGASGLFQFLASTWAANSVRAGYGGASPFDAVANANTAAMMFAYGQAGQWVCR